MIRTISRRAVGLVFAVTVAAVPLIGQPALVPAATSGTLFGLGPASVITIDPTTGATSTFVNLPAVDTFPGASFNSLASDAPGHRLFIQRTVYAQQPQGITATYQIVTVNTADQTATPAVSPDLGPGVSDLAYDSSSHTLFAVTNMCCPFQLVRIDPTTGAETHVADIPSVQPLRMTIAPAKHVIYMPLDHLNLFPRVDTIATIDTTTGAVSQSPAMATGIVELAYDSSSGLLYGKTFCCPSNVVKVDPATGAQTVVASIPSLGSGIAIDSGTHRIYLTDDELGAFSFNQFIVSVDLNTGSTSTSPGALPATVGYVGSLAFEGVAITADSLRADVRSAFASGAIDNAGVANSLLQKLDQAAAARAAGNCAVAANDYRAFVNDVSAQSGKHVAAATAGRLVTEAQFLIANCP